MKKILLSVLLLLVACKKDDTPVQLNYDGKWFIYQTIDKQYTLENGDTAYTRFEVKDYPGDIDYIDFQISNQGKGIAAIYLAGKLDTLAYEAVTPVYFRLDSTLCEISQHTDSLLVFNTLVFDPSVIPDRIQVSQFYYVLRK